MQVVNLSAEPLGKLHAWLPHALHAEKVVFLPDACPGKSLLPTGTTVLTHQQDWRRLLVALPFHPIDVPQIVAGGDYEISADSRAMRPVVFARGLCAPACRVITAVRPGLGSSGTCTNG